MNVKSTERTGNEVTVVVEIDKDLMESGVNKAYLKARKSIQIPGFRKGKAPRKMIEAMYGAHVFYEDGLEEILSGVNKAYLKARKSIQIPGFRKGKAPRKMIEAMYGAHVFYEDGLEEIFPEIYDAAIAKQEGFKAIGRPTLTDMQISEDNVVTLTLTTEVYPEVSLGQYKGLEVEKAEVSVSDEQVQAELDRMAQNVASTETVERAAQLGDTANIDFEGFDNGVAFEGGKGENFDLKLGSGQFVPGFEDQIVGMTAGDTANIDFEGFDNGVAFEGGKGENFDLKLGSGQFVPGFEDQIVGMTAGEEKDINITFPEDYHAELAGKAVVFHVKLNKLSETIVPVQDDEFAKDCEAEQALRDHRARAGRRVC